MRAVVQRVSRASVTVDGEVIGAIERGLCVLVGVGKRDTKADAEQLADKLVGLRIFEDEAGKINRSLLDVGGSLLCISQFTLFADVTRGRRPSFADAMEPDAAKQLFDTLCDACRARGAVVATGRFRAKMQVELVNDGPVTLLVDTEKTAT
jgi:D-tyrosyl-tRNA(Tyr) deacylase